MSAPYVANYNTDCVGLLRTDLTNTGKQNNALGAHNSTSRNPCIIRYYFLATGHLVVTCKFWYSILQAWSTKQDAFLDLAQTSVLAAFLSRHLLPFSSKAALHAMILSLKTRKSCHTSRGGTLGAALCNFEKQSWWYLVLQHLPLVVLSLLIQNLPHRLKISVDSRWVSGSKGVQTAHPTPWNFHIMKSNSGSSNQKMRSKSGFSNQLAFTMPLWSGFDTMILDSGPIDSALSTSFNNFVLPAQNPLLNELASHQNSVCANAKEYILEISHCRTAPQ